MTDLAPHLTTFLREHLPVERRFSRHTVQSYTECFRLLVVYAAERVKTRPSALKIEHFTATLVPAFLEFLESERGNGVSTRNNRLAAIKSFFRYLECRVPECLDLALQVRAIPMKRTDKPLIDWLDRTEMQAILDAPDTGTVAGLRARSSPPGTPGVPCDTAPRCESLRPPRRRKGPHWQSFTPPQRDHPAASVVYFYTAVLTQRRQRARTRGRSSGQGMGM